MTRNIDNKLTLTAVIRDMDGVAYDPDKVELTIQEPDGSKTTYTYADAEIARLGVGVYMKRFVTKQAGWHYYGWQTIAGDNTSELYKEDKFKVEPSLIKKEN